MVQEYSPEFFQNRVFPSLVSVWSRRDSGVVDKTRTILRSEHVNPRVTNSTHLVPLSRIVGEP